MRKQSRAVLGAVLALIAVVALAACGGSSSSSNSSSNTSSTSSSTGTSSTPAAASGPATVVEGTFPQSLDPSIDFTTQGGEVHWLTHIGAYSFAHASGTAGTQVIPAGATALPTVTNGGKTYSFTVRSGMKYSDGTPVKACDLKFGVL